MLDVLTQKRRNKQTKDTNTLLEYFGLGILLCAGIWGLVFLYIKFFPATFSSRGGIRILGGDPGIDISLPNGGRAAPYPISERPKEFQNPKKDYVYIANSLNVLDETATKLKMPTKKFGKPKITVDEDSAIIAFEVQGTSPKQAQQKAIALYETISQNIEKLRKSDAIRREKDLRTALVGVSQDVDISRQKLADYQSRSRFSSGEQITNLSTNIETLRRQRAELLARKQDSLQRLQELSRSNVDSSSPDTSDAYKLQADDVYKQYLKIYAEHSAKVLDLLSRFTEQNPQVVQEKNTLTSVKNELEKRGSLILGKPVSQDKLMRLITITLDPKVAVTREEVSKSLVTSRVEESGLAAQSQELDQQIAQLETRLRLLTQEQLTADKLKRDLQLAETTFASTVAQLNWRKDNNYSIYPPVQLVVEPNLANPNDPNTPSDRVASLTGLAGSFIVITGLYLHWREHHQKPQEDRSRNNET